MAIHITITRLYNGFKLNKLIFVHTYEQPSSMFLKWAAIYLDLGIQSIKSLKGQEQTTFPPFFLSTHCSSSSTQSLSSSSEMIVESFCAAAFNISRISDIYSNNTMLDFTLASVQQGPRRSYAGIPQLPFLFSRFDMSHIVSH